MVGCGSDIRGRYVTGNRYEGTVPGVTFDLLSRPRHFAKRSRNARSNHCPPQCHSPGCAEALLGVVNLFEKSSKPITRSPPSLR